MRFPYSRYFAVLMLLVVWAATPSPTPAQDDEGDEAPDISERVIERYKQILRQRPRELGAFDRLYSLYSERSSIDALLQEYLALAEGEPDEPSHRIVLGHIHKRRGEKKEATAAYLKAVELAPDNAYAQQMLGDVYVLQHLWDKAVPVYEKAIEHKPPLDDRIAISKALGRCHNELGDTERAIETWNRIVELDPKSLFTRLDLAELYRDQGMLDEAIKHYEGIIEIRANDPYWVCKARIEIGKIHERLDRNDEALAAFEQAMALTAQDNWLREEIILLIGEHFRSRNDLAGLADYYRAKLDKDPKDVESIALLAEVFGEMGRDKEAIAQYLKGLEYSPTSVALRTSLIELLGDIARYDEALPHAQRLVKDHPAAIEHHRTLGELYFYAGDDAKAKAAMRGVLLGRMNDPKRRLRLAELLRQFDYVTEAVAEYRAAIGLAPGNNDYLEALGEYFAALGLGRADEALATFLRMVEGEGRATAANYSRLAEVLDYYDFPDEAIEAAKKASALAPDDFKLGERYATLLLRYDRPDDALAVFKAMKAKAPNDFFRAQVEDQIFGILKHQGKLDEEITKAVKAYGNDPGRDRLLTLARMYARAGNPSKQMECLQSARTKAPDDVEVLRRLARLQQMQGKTPDAIATLERLAELDARSARDSLETITYLYIRQGKQNEARAAAQRIVARWPKYPEGYALLSRVEFVFGKNDEAVEALRRAVVLRPKSPDLHFELSKLHQLDGRMKEATEELWKCWQLEESGYARLAYMRMLAELYDEQGRLGELKERLRAMSRHDRRDPIIRFALSEIERFSGDLHAAKRELLRLHTRRSKDPETLLQLIAVCRDLEELNEAVHYQRRLAELEPSPYNRRALGALLFEAGREREAVEVWTALAEESSRDPQSYLRLAELFIKHDLYEHALDALEKAERLEIDRWDMLFDLASTYEALEKWDKAIETYRRVLELPDDAVGGAATRPGAAGRRRSSRYSSNTGSKLYDRLMLMQQIGNQVFQRGSGRGTVAWMPATIVEAKIAALLKLAYAHQQADTLDELEQRHLDRLARDPQDLQELKALVELYFLFGEYDRCLETLDTIITIAPEDVEYRIASYELAKRVGNLERLERDYGFFAEKKDKRATQCLYALVRVLSDGRDPEKLETYLAKTVTDKDGKRKGAADLVHTLGSLGMIERAEPDIKAFMAEEDFNLDKAYGIASTLIRHERFDLALTLMEKIQVRAADEKEGTRKGRSSFYRQVAQAYHRAGRLEEALRHYLVYLDLSTPDVKKTPPPKASGSKRTSGYRRLMQFAQSGSNQPYQTPTALFDHTRMQVLAQAIELSHRLDTEAALREHYESRIEEAEEINKLVPLVALHYIAFLQGDPEAAARRLNEAIATDPANEELLALKVHLLWLRGDYLAAIQQLDEHAKQTTGKAKELLMATFRLASSAGLTERTGAIIETLMKQKLSYDELFRLAAACRASGDTENAAALLEKAAEAAGHDLGQLVRVAREFSQLGHDEQAVALAERILQYAHGKPPRGRSGRGLRPAPSPWGRQQHWAIENALSLLQSSGSGDRLERYIEEAKRNAHSAGALLQLAALYRAAGRTAEELEALEKISSLGRADVQDIAAAAQRLRQRGHNGRAADLYMKAMARSPAIVQNYGWDIAQCFFDAGRGEELVAWVLKTRHHALGLGGPYGTYNLLNPIAETCARRNMLDEAVKLDEKIVRDMPYYQSNVYARLARSYQRLGRPDKALALLERHLLPTVGDGTRRLAIGPYSQRQPNAHSVRELVLIHRGAGTLSQLITRVENAAANRPPTDPLRLALALLYLHDGRPDDAMAEAKSMIHPPTGQINTGAAQQLAQEFVNFGRYEQAIAIYEDIIGYYKTRHSSAEWLMVQMANACSRMGDPERVRTVCLDLAGQVSINRNNSVKLQAASLLEKHGYFDEALAVYEQLGRLVGTGYEAQEAQRRIVRLYMRANRLDELLEALPDPALPLDAQRCEHIAQELQNQGRYTKAIELYKRVVASRPRLRRAREALARCYNATGDYAREAEQWAILADEAPGKSNYVLGLANAWLQAEQHDKAVEALTRLVERWPTPQHRERLASYYVSQEQYDKAIEIYTKLLERQPNNGRALLSLGNAHLAAGDKKNAVAAWRRIPTAQPNVSGWIMLADALASAEMKQEALAACDAAAALKPTNYNELNAIASRYTSNEAFDKAYAALLKALESGQEPWQYQNIAGQMMHIAGQMASGEDTAKAAAFREKILADIKAMGSLPKPTRASLLLNLAASWPSDEKDRKLALLEETIGLDESNPDLLHAAAAQFAGLDAHDDAIALYRRLAVYDPSNRSARVQLATSLAAAGRTEDARRELDGLVLEATHWNTLQEVAGAYLDTLDDAKRAAEVLERAARLEPTASGIAAMRAKALVKQDKKTEALAVLEQVARYMPNAQTYSTFASVLRELEMNEEAETYLERAMKNAPGQSQYLHTYADFLVGAERFEDALALYDHAKEIFSSKAELDRVAGRIDRAGKIMRGEEVEPEEDGDDDDGQAKPQVVPTTRVYGTGGRVRFGIGP